MSVVAEASGTSSELIVTVQQHILHEQRKHFPGADGSFSWLLSGITLATKMIQARVRRAGLLDMLGAAGQTNVQGEVQQKLDVYSNNALMHCLGVRENVAMLVSEENEEPVPLSHSVGTGKYVVIFDPLHGSSNIDVNVSVGTIFSISGYALDSRRPHTLWSATAATAPSRGHRAAVVGPIAAAHCAPRGDGSG